MQRGLVLCGDNPHQLGHPAGLVPFQPHLCTTPSTKLSPACSSGRKHVSPGNASLGSFPYPLHPPIFAPTHLPQIKSNKGPQQPQATCGL